MRILITGGAGFIGSHLVDAFIARGHAVAVVDNFSSGKKENVHPKARLFRMDVESPRLERIFRKFRPQVVLHYAAQIDVRESWEDPLADAQTNILGSLNLLECSRKQKVKKVIFASTGGALYGEASVIPTPETYPAKPISAYGVAKLAVEQYLYAYQKVHGLQFAILRLANVYGPRQDGRGEAGVVGIFSRTLLTGRCPILYGSGTQTRDFVFVEDVVQANIKALAYSGSGTWNIGTGKETTISSLLENIQRIVDFDVRAVRAPLRKGEQRRSCLDAKKATRDLDWSPACDLSKGLGKTIDWFSHSL